jgi:hypothetical protein
LFFIFICWCTIGYFIINNRFIFIIFIDFHIKTSLLCTCNMKWCTTWTNSTLNTCANIFLFTYITSKTPTCSWNLINITYWFKKYCICKMNFWYPDSTNNMGPTFTIINLFESTKTIWT